MALTQPYHLVKTAKTDKDVKFIRNNPEKIRSINPLYEPEEEPGTRGKRINPYKRN